MEGGFVLGGVCVVGVGGGGGGGGGFCDGLEQDTAIIIRIPGHKTRKIHD